MKKEPGGVCVGGGGGGFFSPSGVSSVQFQMVSMHSGKHTPYMRSDPSLRSFPKCRSPLKRFNLHLIDDSPLSRPFKEDRLALPLST